MAQKNLKNLKLVALRLNEGLSARQAADAVGIARGTYTAAEDGENVHPASAKKIADHFNVKVTDLFPAMVEGRDAA